MVMLVQQCSTSCSGNTAAAALSALGLAPSSSSSSSNLRLRLSLPPSRKHSWVTEGWTHRCNSRKAAARHKLVVLAVATRGREKQNAVSLEGVQREAHKYFDHVVLTVRSGDGGDGAVLPQGSQRKAKTGGKKATSQKWEPPVAADGADVIVYVDERFSSLLPLYETPRLQAKHGSHANTMSTDTRIAPRKPPALRVAVPPGTVVRRRRGGRILLLADLQKPGEEVVVLQGGKGGISTIARGRAQVRSREEAGEIVEAGDEKLLAKGNPGEEAVLDLVLRVVADVGIVGFPNAGKSSLLAAVTRAKPQVADYPFTTLMPNLGVAQPDLDSINSTNANNGDLVMADLPGLIEGAHLGKGLGRMFLRHLSRTRVLLMVLDVTAEDPVAEYSALREELRMYNPAYVLRPHLVILNKVDLLEEDTDRVDTIADAISKLAYRTSVESSATGEAETTPAAIRAISAKQGEGVSELVQDVRAVLHADDKERRKRSRGADSRRR
eukprot:jgi/Chlat1/7753/Chrsp66S07230